MNAPKLAVTPKDPFTAFSSFSLFIPKACVTGLLFGDKITSVAPEGYILHTLNSVYELKRV